MMVQIKFPSSDAVIYSSAIAILAITIYYVRVWWRLRHIPGPFPGNMTNFLRVKWVTTKRAHLILQEMHEKYGEVVRIGPNTVSFNNPSIIPTIYTARTGFPKAKFYNTLQAYSPTGGALPAIFNTTDDKMHKRLKTPISPLFAPNTVTVYEGRVDEVLGVLQKQLDAKFIGNSEVFELGQWLQFFAFDVMGTLTFSKRYGFLEHGKDEGNMLATIVDFMRRSAPMTQIPWLDWLLRKNRIGDFFQRTFFSQPSMGILNFIAKAIKERQIKGESGAGEEKGDAGHTQDFLDKYLEVQRKSPDVPPWGPTTWVFSNIIAGSDSVGTIMRTAMFNMLLYKHTFQKLYDELQAANVTRPYPKFSEIRNLPYLDACVQEAIRMHPPFALPFERVVPKGGIEVLGYHIPEGTDIGGNPYVVNRHKGTFGMDAEFWRPERWYEKGEAHKVKLEQSMLTFGAGRRVCIGRHIGIMEVKKILSFMVINYDINIVRPELWRVENSWFFFQRGLYSTIKPRALPTE
ncbi:cytochrome P450 CYP4/CYP19/CYP26 subfamily [Stachybotrys elegans]|uniref:Cytochrome P450 CYP4/CYP19/CYP26 subfamily n=1 Tax=Stachybotrys elegans TaxID=80388 RepID=A0A8K0SSU8_9HYPO|nr:cytochrome P450 CYP4/CYP19/CYP26 subfamily [Stachybotrys elegans]